MRRRTSPFAAALLMQRFNKDIALVRQELENRVEDGGELRWRAVLVPHPGPGRHAIAQQLAAARDRPGPGGAGAGATIGTNLRVRFHHLEMGTAEAAPNDGLAFDNITVTGTR